MLTAMLTAYNQQCSIMLTAMPLLLILFLILYQKIKRKIIKKKKFLFRYLPISTMSLHTAWNETTVLILDSGTTVIRPKAG